MDSKTPFKCIVLALCVISASASPDLGKFAMEQ
jgi:hypothetical protein